ncbi:HAD-IA family hydrolase [Pikeienuella sp. HZG-20]|uniref:HAD-IA family hydrolase n=1 Tax=Paludibacillus litoralis TaxID=3133267 RepID=UPI0030EEC168
MKLRAVIFDFGGVFTSSPVSHFAEYERREGLPERFLGGVIKARLGDGAFSRFERAEISLDEFDAAFAAETRAAGHEVTGRTLLSLMKLDFRPDMIAALDRIGAAGFLTGCITNNMPGGGAVEWARNEDGRAMAAEVLAKFDHLIESAKAGVRKPEPRIYEMMCEALGVAPAECVFVDDLGVNLKPAAAMGMRVVRVPFDDYRVALAELSALTGLDLQEKQDV